MGQGAWISCSSTRSRRQSSLLQQACFSCRQLPACGCCSGLAAPRVSAGGGGCMMLHCTMLHYILLHSIALSSDTYIQLHTHILYYSMIRYTCASLHYATSHYVALQYNTFHSIMHDFALHASCCTPSHVIPLHSRIIIAPVSRHACICHITLHRIELCCAIRCYITLCNACIQHTTLHRITVRCKNTHPLSSKIVPVAARLGRWGNARKVQASGRKALCQLPCRLGPCVEFL